MHRLCSLKSIDMRMVLEYRKGTHVHDREGICGQGKEAGRSDILMGDPAKISVIHTHVLTVKGEPNEDGLAHELFRLR